MGDVINLAKWRKENARRLYLYYVATNGDGIILDGETKEKACILDRSEMELLINKGLMKGTFDVEGVRQYAVKIGELAERDTLRMTAGKYVY